MLRSEETATYDALRDYWKQIGQSDSDFISYIINPQFNGAPPWPNMRQAYRIVRTDNSLIIASDGLCDPFEDDDKDTNGYGMEVMIEVPDQQALAFNQIRESWIFSVIEMFAQNVANAGGIVPQLEEFGVMSMELPLGFGPDGFLSDNGMLGALIGLPMADRPNVVENTPLSPVRIVPLTLVYPEEIAVCTEGGSDARSALADDLMARKNGWLTDPNRESLR